MISKITILTSLHLPVLWICITLWFPGWPRQNFSLQIWFWFWFWFYQISWWCKLAMVGSFQSFRISFQFQLMEPNYLVRPQTDTAPLASYSVYLLVHKWYFIVIINKVNQNAGSKLFHLLVIQLVDEMFRNLSWLVTIPNKTMSTFKQLQWSDSSFLNYGKIIFISLLLVCIVI